jgi:hypothetical protein
MNKPKLPVPNLASSNKDNPSLKGLHSRLGAFSKNRLDGWLQQLWDEAAYLSSREPLLLNSNCATVLEYPNTQKCMFKSAAQVVHACLEWNNPTEIVMGAHRQAAPAVDRVRRARNSQHIVVNYRGKYHALKVILDDGTLCSKTSIERGLREIVEYCVGAPKTQVPMLTGRPCTARAVQTTVDKLQYEENRVSLLTTTNRDVWIKNYQMLRGLHFENRESLQKIEDSLFALTLDDYSKIGSHSETMMQTMCHPRVWFDKSLNWCIYKDGTIGLNGEHSCMDGVDIHKLLFHVVLRLQKSLKNAVDEKVSTEKAVSQQLFWHLNSELRQQIRQAEDKFPKLAKRHSSMVGNTEVTGASTLRRMGISADAFIQQAFQLTYYDLHGKVAETYESVSTSQFKYGRTENGRPLTDQMVALIKAIRGNKKEPIAALMHQVSKVHSNKVRKCANGQGTDRLILGLHHLAREAERSLIPELKPCPLVTTHMGHQHFIFDVGTLMPESYSCVYKILPCSIRWCISVNNDSKTVNLCQFEKKLRENCTELYGYLTKQSRL